MRTHYLYLLAGLFALLGGCSRCERSEDAKPVMTQGPFGIVSYVNISHYFVGDSLVVAKGTDTTDVFAPNGGNAFYLEATDSTWEEYVWRFANTVHTDGHLDTGRRIALTYRPLGQDVATLTAYRHNRKDSAVAQKAFSTVSWFDLSLKGTYKGSFTYNGETYPDVELQIDTMGAQFINCQYSDPALVVRGLFMPCGHIPLTFIVQAPASLKGFKPNTSVLHFRSTDSSYLNHPECGVPRGTIICNFPAFRQAYGALDRSRTLRLMMSLTLDYNSPSDRQPIPIFFKGQKI